MGKVILSCRDVLWILVFFGFAVNYMLRTNLNLTIVAMVKRHEVPAYKRASSQCASIDNSAIDPWTNLASKNYSWIVSSTIQTTQDSLSKIRFDDDKYEWDEYDQSLALGAYYWIHWVTQLPGGLLARRYGTKLIFGLGNLATAVLGMLIPIFTRYHLYGLVTLRVLQGLIAGVMWPSMHDMTAKWIPQNERGKFVSSYLGSSIGAAVTYPLCALCIDWYGWAAAFYTSSLVGIVWYCFWYFLVFDTPQQHPRISETERDYILDKIGNTITEEIPVDVPWRKILTSGPLWITTIAHWGGVWGFLTFMTEAPTYLTYVHGWNINATGILSGLPHLLRMAFSYFFGILSDWLLRTKRMSLTNVRKLATFMCTGVQGLMTLGLGFSGCEPNLAIFFIMAGTAVNGAVSAGTLANLVDLSPNYASVLLGFAGLVTASAGFISPMIVGILTNNNQTIEQWRLVFIIAAANLGLSAIVYTIWGTSNEQPWNFAGKTLKANPEELEQLRTKTTKNSDEAKTENVNNTIDLPVHEDKLH